jgi:hypothetical protein
MTITSLFVIHEDCMYYYRMALVGATPPRNVTNSLVGRTIVMLSGKGIY